MIQSTY